MFLFFNKSLVYDVNKLFKSQTVQLWMFLRLYQSLIHVCVCSRWTDEDDDDGCFSDCISHSFTCVFAHDGLMKMMMMVVSQTVSVTHSRVCLLTMDWWWWWWWWLFLRLYQSLIHVCVCSRWTDDDDGHSGVVLSGHCRSLGFLCMAAVCGFSAERRMRRKLLSLSRLQMMMIISVCSGILVQRACAGSWVTVTDVLCAIRFTVWPVTSAEEEFFMIYVSLTAEHQTLNAVVERNSSHTIKLITNPTSLIYLAFVIYVF